MCTCCVRGDSRICSFICALSCHVFENTKAYDVVKEWNIFTETQNSGLMESFYKRNLPNFSMELKHSRCIKDAYAILIQLFKRCILHMGVYFI